MSCVFEEERHQIPHEAQPANHLKKVCVGIFQLGYLHPAAEIQDEANMLLTLSPRK